MKLGGSIKAFRAKNMVAKEGMHLAVELGIRALILEVNSQLIIESFESNFNDLSYNGLVLIEAFRLALGLNFFKAQYTPKDCNSIADRLAKLVKN